MSRLIFVPQYPTTLRYQEWWFTEFPKRLKKYFDGVTVIGNFSIRKSERGDKTMFSPIEKAIDFELNQIDQYMKTYLNKEDTLFLADISFPGLFANILHHRKPDNCFAFCHATSKNKYDYFEPVYFSKFPVETGQAILFDKIFVGSYYHKEKLGWADTIVTRLPKPPFEFFDSFKQTKKDIDVVSASRPTPQKVDLELEQRLEKIFGQIQRPPKNITAWIQYYAFLSRAKVLLVTAQEETFGYQVMDAILSNCIPICPNRLSYPELLPRTYLYDTENELIELLINALNGKLEVPKLLCENEVDNFFETIGNLMKGE